MSIEPINEVGVDYDGVDKRHHQVNEVRFFSNAEAERIFMPECGAFYTESLNMVDANTNRPLVFGVDYKVAVLDSRATTLSGKEVCGVIEVINIDVLGVILDYQFVGGIHMRSFYLLEQLLKMYSKGINSVINFNDLMDVPAAFDPAHHTQHVQDFFRTDSLLVWLERLHQGVVHRYEKNLANMYEVIQGRIDNLHVQIGDAKLELEESVADTLNVLSIQPGEYILTDSSENPSISKGYGQWQLVTDSVLYGQTSAILVVGSGSLMETGKRQIIRNCYIWKNITGLTELDFVIEVTANKGIIDEGEDIEFTIQTAMPQPTGFDNNVRWMIIPSNSNEPTINTDLSKPSGVVTLDVSGRGVVSITTLKDVFTEGVRGYRFILVNNPKCYADFVVNDTSNTGNLNSVNFFYNGEGVDLVGEDQEFSLRIASNPVNTRVYLQWDLSNIDPEVLLEPLPTVIDTAGNPLIFIPVCVVGDYTENPEIRRISVQVSIIEGEFTQLPDIHPFKSTVLVADTSKTLGVMVEFLVNGSVISAVGEGVEFVVKIKTNAKAGKVLELTYNTNVPLDAFTNLPVTGIADENGIIAFNCRVREDFATAGSLQYLDVGVNYASVVLGLERLVISDSSTEPNLVTYFTSDYTTLTPLTQINEGDAVFFVIRIPGWTPSFEPLMLDVTAIGVGLPSLAQRVTLPDFNNPISFDNNNDNDAYTWYGDRLAILVSAINDFAAYEDYDVSIAVKRVDTPIWHSATLKIKDTSKPTITAAWSSSKTVLTPLTSVQEMKTTGIGEDINYVAYLWINVVGDMAGYLNPRLVISPTGVNDASILGSPNLTLQASQVFDVEFNADFITEGNETLEIKGIADDTVDILVTTSVVIEDNSFLQTLSVVNNSISTHYTGKFSEWDLVKVTATTVTLPFDTIVRLTATPNHVGGVAKVVDVVLPAYTNVAVLTHVMNAARLVLADPEYMLNLKIQQFKGLKAVTNQQTLTMSVYNDKRPPTTTLDIIDVSTGTIVNTLVEGGDYVGVFTVISPMSNTAMVVGFHRRSDTVGGEIGSNSPLVDIPSDLHIGVVIPLEDNLAHTYEFSVSVISDRATNGEARTLKIAAKYTQVDVYEVGDIYEGNLSDNLSGVATSVTLPITDTSKTIGNTYVFKNQLGEITSTFNEGDVITVEVTSTQATVGDVYVLGIDPAKPIPLSRFSGHEFGSKQVTINNTTTQTYTFTATVDTNYTTNGDTTFGLLLTNTTAGTSQQIGDLTILDTSVETTLSITVLNKTGAMVDTMLDGEEYTIRVNAISPPPNSNVRLTRVDGRELSDFLVHEFDTAKTLVGNKIEFPLTFKKLHETNAVNHLKVNAVLVEDDTIEVERSIPVVDQVRPKGITAAFRKGSDVTSELATSVREGEAVWLVFTANGGDLPLTLEVKNNGGRSPAELDGESPYTSSVRNNDSEVIAKYFAIKADGETNTGDSTKLKVRIEYTDNVTSDFLDVELPIVDTSTGVTAKVEFRDKTPANSIVTTMSEGVMYEVRFALTDPVLNERRYRIVVSNNGHDGGGLNLDVVGMTGDQFQKYPTGGDEWWCVTPIHVATDGRINDQSELNVTAEIWDTVTNTKLKSNSVRIIDTESLAPEYSLWVADAEGNILTDIAEDSLSMLRVHFTCNRAYGEHFLYYDNLKAKYPSGSKMIRFHHPTIPVEEVIGKPLSIARYADQNGASTSFSPMLLIPRDDELDIEDIGSKFYIANEAGEVVVEYPFKLNNVGKEPKITSVYFAHDELGLQPITEFPITPYNVAGGVFYLVAHTVNISDETNPLIVQFPKISGVDNIWLNDSDLEVGKTSEPFIHIYPTITDVNTGVGVANYKFKFRTVGGGTLNGTYHFYSNKPEIVIEPNRTKMLTIYSAGNINLDNASTVGAGGVTGFYLPKNDFKINDSYPLRQGDAGFNVTAVRAANNHAYSVGPDETINEELARGSVGFLLLRGKAGKSGSTPKSDIDGITFCWGGSTIAGPLMPSPSIMNDYDTNGPDFLNRKFTTNGVDMLIVSKELMGDGTTKTVVLVRAPTDSICTLKTTYGRVGLPNNSTDFAKFGGGLNGVYNEGLDGKIVVGDATWPTMVSANTPTVFLSTHNGAIRTYYASVSEFGYTNPGYGITAAFNHIGALTKLEVLVDGNVASKNFFITRGRNEGYKRVNGVYDGSTYTAVNIPLNGLLRTLAFSIDSSTSANSSMTIRYRLTFAEGSVITTNPIYSPNNYITTPYVTPMYPFV